MAKISFKGLDKLEKKLIENVKMEEVKKVVRDNGLTLQGNVVKNAGEVTFNKGYFTGNLKQDVAGHGLSGTRADGLFQAPDRHGVVGGAFRGDLPTNLEATGQQGAPLPADVGAGFWWPR